MLRAIIMEVRFLMKCGLCGAEVKEQPKITADGKCSVCGAKLAVKK
jgi:DNA-directed RNA polymerase subunit RPC12/RpoP